MSNPLFLSPLPCQVRESRRFGFGGRGLWRKGRGVAPGWLDWSTQKLAGEKIWNWKRSHPPNPSIRIQLHFPPIPVNAVETNPLHWTLGEFILILIIIILLKPLPPSLLPFYCLSSAPLIRAPLNTESLISRKHLQELHNYKVSRITDMLLGIKNRQIKIVLMIFKRLHG
jgi:hypothetical protein